MRRKLFNYHIEDGYVYKRYRDNQDVFIQSHEYNPIKLSAKDRNYLKKNTLYKNNIHIFFTHIEENFTLLFNNNQNQIIRTKWQWNIQKESY